LLLIKGDVVNVVMRLPLVALGYLWNC